MLCIIRPIAHHDVIFAKLFWNLLVELDAVRDGHVGFVTDFRRLSINSLSRVVVSYLHAGGDVGLTP